MLELLLNALGQVASLQTMFFLTLGVVVGLVFGVIPGLGGSTALAILMPLTFDMPAVDAFAMAGGIMGAVTIGGAVPSILLNCPGTGPSAATCLDGYPLAKQGRSAEAIGAASVASATGSILGILVLLFILPAAKEVVLLFGPPEFFLVTIFGLLAIAISDSGNLLRGLIAAGVGLLLSFVGYDSVTGEVRFALGSLYLWDGIPMIPALIGLFGITEMIRLSITGGTVAKETSSVKLDGVITGMRAAVRNWKTTIRGSLLGTVIGTVPGVGGTVASFVSYSVTKGADPNPETFGMGRIEGVIAPESTNSAKDGGALLPTLAFGIPGSAEMAVFLGIIVLHGMQPGPAMLLNNEHEIYVLMLTVAAGGVLACVLGIALVRWLAMVTVIKGQYLAPLVIAVSLVGAYVIDSRPGDVVLAAVMGILGYLMLRFRYPRLPLVIALILGETAERGFLQSMMIGNDSWLIFVSSPTSIVLVALIVLTVSWFAVAPLRRIVDPRGKSLS